MKRWLPWLVLAACARPPACEPAGGPLGGDEEPVAARGAVAASIEAPPAAPPPPEAPYAISQLPLAPHTIAAVVDGGIADLAVPADGSYAVTLDTSGGVLLWPALDGTREPVVVPARIGTRIATLRDGDAIAVAVVDKLGQLELVRVTGDGAPIAHDDIAVPRPVVELVATSQRLIALRDDQALAAFDAEGALAGELEAARGERIARLVTRNDHVVAVSAARRGKRTARALELGVTLAWAAPSKRFASDEDGLALSPDGKRLLATIDQHAHSVRIDLARGTTEQIDDEFREVANSQTVIGFRDDHTAVFADEGKVFERSDGSNYAESNEAYARAAVFTPARAIGGLGTGYLVVIEHDRAKYLGYRSGPLADVLPSSEGGWLATDGGGMFHLDASLRLDKRIETPFPRRPSWERVVTLVDERHALIVAASKRYLFELGADHGDLLADKAYGGLELVRSTGLAVLPETRKVVHWNAELSKFEPALDVGDGTYGGFVRLYDPATTGGMIAMIVDSNEPSEIEGKQKVAIREVYGSPPKLHFRDRVEYVENGLLFSGHSGPNLEIVMPVATVRATSVDRTLIAELANDRITMMDHDGNVRWARPAAGARGLAWNRDDELIAFGDGIAHVDLDTGDYADRRCGWDFGLWDVPPETTSSARMCVLP